jgi:hypothetical protein
VKLTNNTVGARGVNLKDGTTAWIEPGETREFDKADVANVHADLNPKGAKDADEPAAPKPLDKMNKGELLAVAEAEKVTTAKDGDGKDVEVASATNAQIVTAIEAARAAAQA